MFCPECGAEAGAANFCPECGTDLRGLSATPECAACGSEVPGGARFCPECGEPTGSQRDARAAETTPAAATGSTPTRTTGAGRRTGTRGKSVTAGEQRRQRRQEPRPQQAAPAPQPGRVSPAVAWGILGAVVVIAVVIVILVAGRSGGDSGATAATTSPQPVQSVAADTSGSYGELVARANGLYDQGAAQLQSEQWAQSAAYFLAASKVYAAAWKQQSTEASVGTDYATSLFYAGRIDAALEQVDEVLAQSPEFQTAWFNKGNYLAERARQAEEAGDKKAADKDYAAARVAYQKAVDLDPASSSGQSAKEQLGKLPQ
jgi:hypothetical protein